MQMIYLLFQDSLLVYNNLLMLCIKLVRVKWGMSIAKTKVLSVGEEQAHVSIDGHGHLQNVYEFVIWVVLFTN